MTHLKQMVVLRPSRVIPLPLMSQSAVMPDMLLTIAQPWLGMVFVTLSATTPLAGMTEATAGPHHHHQSLNLLALRVIHLLIAHKELAMEFAILNVIPMLVDKMVEIVN